MPIRRNRRWCSEALPCGLLIARVLVGSLNIAGFCEPTLGARGRLKLTQVKPPWRSSFHTERMKIQLRNLVMPAALASALLSLVACGSSGDETAPPPPPPLAKATFQRLGTLPGYTRSQSAAVSADGRVVAGTAEDSGGRQQAFRWNAASGIVALGFPPGGTRSAASGISADGSVVVGYANSTEPPGSASVAFRWTTVGMERITPLAGSTLCGASGVSGDGRVVVGVCLAHNNVGFHWTQSGGGIGLGQLGGGSSASSNAAAISNDGLVIAGSGNPFIAGAVVWTLAGTRTILGKLQPDDSNASASALSADGAVVVGNSYDSASQPRMFRWTLGSGMQPVPGVPTDVTASFASAVSGDGRVIVGYWSRGASNSAVIWDEARGMRPLAQALANEYGLTLAGWTLQQANAVSADGRVIAGTGLNPQGELEAWVVRLD